MANITTEELFQSKSLVLSYLDLRKAIGIIGMTLPFILVLGKIIFESSGIQSSISAYYYTVMRDVFVGGLCAIGVFLASYRGYGRIDNIAGNLACVFALGTAFFPTTPEISTTISSFIGIIHYIFSASLFFTLVFFSLVLFRKTSPNVVLTPRKEKRNLIYTICGYVILICMLLIVAVDNMPNNLQLQNLSPVFWLESTSLIAFGISWFVKGEAILKDK